MRPDKHKKKKQAAYAKKASQRRNDASSSKGTKGKAADITLGLTFHKVTTEQNPNFDVEIPPQASGTETLEHSNSRQGNDDIATSQALTDKCEIPTFSRRKIQSNWQQYDETPKDEATVEQRGADFTLLQNQTAGSQFRFKDEETLDDEYVSTSPDDSSFLSFDCDELAIKLQSISLPERLEISRTVFDVETLEMLDQDVATSNILGISENQKQGSMIENISVSQNPLENYLDKELDAILLRKETDDSVNKPMKVDKIQSTLLEPNNESDSTSYTFPKEESIIYNGVDSSALNSGPVTKETYTSSNLSDGDELDFLLTLQSPVTDDGNYANANNLDIPDTLTSFEEITTNKSPGQSIHEDIITSGNVQKTIPTYGGEAESRDDWLNSILDD